MRWPWQGRGRHAKGRRVVFLGVDGAPSPLPVVEPREAEPAVQLGFADGSTLALAGDDPRAVALREAAARLTTKD